MVRKRATGAGRKPKGDTAMRSFSWRMPEDMRDELDKAARKSRRNISDELLARLRWSFAREREQERDPALRALNFVIAQLAERVSGGMYYADKEFRLEQLKEWRTDPFKFAAFKVAVGKLLDALEPPAEQKTHPALLSAAERAAIREKALRETAKERAEKFGYTPEMEKWFIETQKTPEAYGASQLAFLWDQLTRANPLTEKEKEMARRYPRFGEVIEHEFYGFQKAQRDLGIDKPKSERGD